EQLSRSVFQAGISWRVVDAKWSTIKPAFRGFQVERVARMGDREIDTLAADPRVIRSRPKIAAVVHNARAILDLERDGGFRKHLRSFGDYERIATQIHDGTICAQLPPPGTSVMEPVKRTEIRIEHRKHHRATVHDDGDRAQDEVREAYAIPLANIGYASRIGGGRNVEFRAVEDGADGRDARLPLGGHRRECESSGAIEVGRKLQRGEHVSLRRKGFAQRIAGRPRTRLEKTLQFGQVIRVMPVCV